MKSFPVAGGRSVSLALFSDVSNSRELLDLMQSGKLEPEAAFLNASLITESLKRCGIADDTQYILAARFDASDEEMKALEKLISGTEIDLSELETRADQPKILKQYKITPQELSISTLPEAIVCRIAARDAL
ncbi:hypothetical protein CFC21_039547 [Triticum aestivum]|uniref:EKC/KEOPS complex subunit CGI121 n=3 Tax=Triticum TaxID=4564 RepID=A0A9R1Q730_TRITD|nr:hypothetical protein CFC21_039547 [Triticum aestivum]VAH71991.1 unnamed protein product [Triticum turgidum subsp. durum]